MFLLSCFRLLSLLRYDFSLLWLLLHKRVDGFTDILKQ